MEPQPTILVVDDNPVNLRLLTQILERADYKVQALMDGARALSVIKSTPPDLILLDIIMPGINGFELCKRIKADEESREIPLIFISALDDQAEKVQAFEAGAVDYIIKPFRRLEVLARVSTHLKLHLLTRTMETENAELHEKLAELQAENAEVKRQNQELRAYDISVAHDLKLPLSNVVSTADWLVQSYDQLPKKERDTVLRNLLITAEKASHIIDSLLELSQPDGVEIVPVEMEPVINDVLASLRPMTETYDARFLIPDSLPSVMGNENLLGRIWDNYLSNAIKYGGKPPKVMIGYEFADDKVKYWVQDNGKGIPADSKAQLFKPFSKVSDDEYVGHGLGLYLVQRSILSMGGEVGVETARNGSNRFYFILPAAVM